MGKIKKEMENTIENKSKFFAQYWGQEVMAVHGKSGNFGVKKCRVQSNHLSDVTTFDFIELKPPLKMSDDDAIEASNIFYKAILKGSLEAGKLACEALLEGTDNMPPLKVMALSDFLRSIGYALPYNGLSVETQIAYGWVRLSE